MQSQFQVTLNAQCSGREPSSSVSAHSLQSQVNGTLTQQHRKQRYFLCPVHTDLSNESEEMDIVCQCMSINESDVSGHPYPTDETVFSEIETRFWTLFPSAWPVCHGEWKKLESWQETDVVTGGVVDTFVVSTYSLSVDQDATVIISGKDCDQPRARVSKAHGTEGYMEAITQCA